jgi:hypothetical protein
MCDWMDRPTHRHAFEATVRLGARDDLAGMATMTAQAAMYGLLCVSDIRRAVTHSDNPQGQWMADRAIAGAVALAARAHQCWLGKCLLEARYAASHALRCDVKWSDDCDGMGRHFLNPEWVCDACWAAETLAVGR